MRTWFRTMGRARTYTIGFAPGLSLDAMAEQLVDAVGRIRSVNGLPHLAPVQLVAHSMGGVVCRLALLDPTFARGIERILTLGTPHAGTEAARFAATMQTLELRPDSAALARLRPALPWSGPPLTAFWSPSDLLILPPESARLEGATNVRMEGFTHYSWLIDPRMWQAAWERLAPPEDESPEPDEAAPDAAR